MSAMFQTVALWVAIALAWLWITNPLLSPFALQAFAGSILLYFLVKRLSKSKLWHIVPNPMSWEMIIATFAFCLLTGATGNTESPFFPLTFVHLFFLVLATPITTSLIISGALVLFHYVLAPDSLATTWPLLSTIPLVNVFFLFGKYQHEEVLREREIITQDEKIIAVTQADQKSLLEFITVFLTSKINHMKKLTEYPQLNKDALTGQLTLLEIELQQLLSQFKKPIKEVDDEIE